MAFEFTILLVLVAGACALSWYLAPRPWAHALLALGRRAAGLSSRHIEVNGLEWHYLEGGRGPWLVAVHGFGADADNWLRVARPLRRHFRILAPDLIGFGSSHHGDALGFDIVSQASRLEDLLEALNVERCVMAGNSMGAWIAAVYAERNPARVDALWLLAPLGVTNAPRSDMLAAIETDTDSPLKLSSFEDYERRVYRPMFVKPPWLPYPLHRYYGRRAVRRSPAAVRMFRDVRQTPRPLEDTAAALKMPVLLQWGNRDQAVDVSGADSLEAASRHIDIDILDEVGHLPMLESPRRSVRRFLDFARRHGLIDPRPN